MATAKEEQLFKFISNFEENTSKVAKTKKTLGFLTARKELLADYWTRYNSVCDELRALNMDAEKEGQIEDRLASTEATYCAAMGDLNDSINEFKNHQVVDTDTTMSQPITASAHASTIRTILPKIELPKFDGSFKKWLNYKDMFITCVINEETLSNVERMHYLKVQRYDNKRRLVKSYIHDLINLPEMEGESAMALRRLLDGASEAVRALEQLGRPTQHWDDWLVCLVSEKLDAATAKDWEMSLDTPNFVAEFKKLSDFFENRLHG